MNNIFELAAGCLHKNEIDLKLETTRQAFQLSKSGALNFCSEQKPQSISKTSFPERPELRDPRTMPRRKFTTREGKIAFFHAIAHIEFMAIYLAWDIIYRFRGMPDQFYQDWLRVAAEEALHFSMIRAHLQQMEVDYGDLPAHSGLWDIAEDSADSLLARLALVPRYMEAHGLDVTPAMVEKFSAMGDRESVKILTRILEDEIGHVELGSFWFRFQCERQDCEPESTYMDLIATRMKGKPRTQINRELRKKAGFSDVELDWLENLTR